MNLTCQEILKNIKAGEAQDEDEILKEISKENDNINIPYIAGHSTPLCIVLP